MGQKKGIVWTKNLHLPSDPLNPEFLPTVLHFIVFFYSFFLLLDYRLFEDSTMAYFSLSTSSSTWPQQMLNIYLIQLNKLNLICNK